MTMHRWRWWGSEEWTVPQLLAAAEAVGREAALLLQRVEPDKDWSPGGGGSYDNGHNSANAITGEFLARQAAHYALLAERRKDRRSQIRRALAS